VSGLTPEVAAAVEAVRAHFAGHPVEVTPDGAGGCFMVVEDVEVGDRYEPPITWLGFHISAACPMSDVYPHYVGLLSRVDGHPHGGAIQQVSWRDRPALQVSRRSNRWNPKLDNAANKAEKVIVWLSGQ
jgi:hypothetical protein